MSKISTAEEILLKQGVTKSPISGLETYLKSNAKNAMIEFAKLHVEAALKEASENAFITNHNPTLDDDRFYKKTDKNSILNAYPLTNIK